jgi:hypothetical protein
MAARSPRRGSSFALFAVLAACDRAPPPSAVQRPAITGSPLAGVTAVNASFVATVREVLRAGSYSYFDVELDDGSRRWAVMMGPALVVGTRVRVDVFGTRRDFDSPRLRRRFATLDFARVVPV